MNENQYPESVADICDAAADFIETHGWHQGGFARGGERRWHPGVPVCAYGGILGVCGQLGPNAFYLPGWTLSDFALDALEKHLGVCGIGDWNDHPSRTQAEVVQALRDTAIKHRTDEMRVGGRSEPS